MSAASDLALLTDGDAAAFAARMAWLETAKTRGGRQIPPVHDPSWRIWSARAGRGWGKSRSIYEQLWWDCWRVPRVIGHAVAPTGPDLRSVTFDGPAGLLRLIPAECLLGGNPTHAYNRSTHELRLANGSLIRGFSATDDGARLRGPQCHVLAGDEIAEWDRPAGTLERALNNALFGLRLPWPDGTPARAYLATTPRPITFLKKLERRDDVRTVTGSSRENLANLDAEFRRQIASVDGTLLGRQEVDGAYIDEESDTTILRRAWLKLWPADKPLPAFEFLLESYDTAFTDETFDARRMPDERSDYTACLVLGVFNTHLVFDEAERRRLKLRGRRAALLLDAWHERLGFPELLDRARSQHRLRWGPPPGRRADLALIEEKGSGISLRQSLARYDVPTWPYQPGHQSKTTRAHAIAPLWRGGMMWVPESGRPDLKGMPRDWAEPFLEQVCAFSGPGSVEHDDYVDAVSSAMLYLRDRGLLEDAPEPVVEDYEEQRARDRELAEDQWQKQRLGQGRSWYGS